MSPERRLLFPASSSAAMRAAGTWTRYSLVFSPRWSARRRVPAREAGLDERERGAPAPSTGRASGFVAREHGGAATASRRDASRAASARSIAAR